MASGVASMTVDKGPPVRRKLNGIRWSALALCLVFAGAFPAGVLAEGGHQVPDKHRPQIRDQHQAELQEGIQAEPTEGPEVHWHDRTGAARQIRGTKLQAAVTDASVPEAERDHLTARAFLRTQGNVLRLRDPDVELTLERRDQDENGRRYLRFSQLHKGIPVWPAIPDPMMS